MLLVKLIVLLLGVFESQQRQEHQFYKFNTWINSQESATRILELMRSYYEEANARIKHMNPMRFMYEESPHYEMGYIIGEIIERYRKVVEHAQRPFRFHFYSVFDTMKRVELVQKLYFEIYHLVRMIHETPRKWRTTPEFNAIEQIAGPEEVFGRLTKGSGFEDDSEVNEQTLADRLAMEKLIADNTKRREKDRKRERRKNERIRQAYMLGLIKDMRGKGKEYNKWWPIDYGWEIDYEW